jgi:hypothetical protein
MTNVQWARPGIVVPVFIVAADADLDELTSVSIWCDRCNVSFGAADLS